MEREEETKKERKEVRDDSTGGKYCRNEPLVRRAQYHITRSQETPHSYTLRRRLTAIFLFLLLPTTTARIAFCLTASCTWSLQRRIPPRPSPPP